MGVYENLKEKEIELPQQLAAAGLYQPVTRFGSYLYVSGQGSMQGDTHICGTVGKNMTVEEGAAAARLSAANTLIFTIRPRSLTAHRSCSLMLLEKWAAMHALPLAVLRSPWDWQSKWNPFGN